MHGKDVALKAADLHKQTVLVEQLEDEIEVLGELHYPYRMCSECCLPISKLILHVMLLIAR